MGRRVWFGRRRILAIAVAAAGLAAGTFLLGGTGKPRTHYPPLLSSAAPDAELVWPSGPRGAASAGSVLAPAGSRALAVVQSFAGSSSAETSGDPPDPVVGVGAGFVVQMVNSAVRVWTTDGSALATYPLAAFARASSSDVSDPGIVYDPGSGRWFASVVDVARASIQLAVSSSSDPTGPWTVFSHATGSCPDQPSLGVTSRFVVVGYGAFSAPCRSDPAPTYLGGAFFTYDKQALLAGSAKPVDWGPKLYMSPVAAVSTVDGPGRAVGLVLPPAAGGPTYLAIIGLDSATAITKVPIRPLALPPPAGQAGTSQPIATNDVRILSAVVQGRTLWLAGNDGCIPSRDRDLRSCLRILAVTGNRVGVDADVGVPGRNFFYPALAPARGGGVLVAHGFSSGRLDPGLAVFAITAGGRKTREVTIASSTGPYLSDRYGDYFGAATDESGHVWVTGETTVLPSTAGLNDLPTANWATAVVSVAVR